MKSYCSLECYGSQRTEVMLLVASLMCFNDLSFEKLRFAVSVVRGNIKNIKYAEAKFEILLEAAE